MEWMATQRAVMQHPPGGAAQTLFLKYPAGKQPGGAPDCVRESTAPFGIYCEAEMTANSGDQYFFDHRVAATRDFFARTVAMGAAAMGSDAIDGLYQGETDGGSGGSLEPWASFLNPLDLFLRTSIPLVWRILSAFLPT